VRGGREGKRGLNEERPVGAWGMLAARVIFSLARKVDSALLSAYLVRGVIVLGVVAVGDGRRMRR
jgi:hypothetical protein